MLCHVLCIVWHTLSLNVLRSLVDLSRVIVDRYRQAFSFGKGDENALLYLRELRQNGTDRRGELASLISGEDLEWRAIKAAEDYEVRQSMETLCFFIV